MYARVCLYLSVFVSLFVYGSCELVCVSISVLIFECDRVKKTVKPVLALSVFALFPIYVYCYCHLCSSHCTPTGNVESGSSSHSTAQRIFSICKTIICQILASLSLSLYLSRALYLSSLMVQ